MNIQIGTTTSEKNRLNKNFSVIASLDGELTEDSNIVNPSILVNYNNSYATANYVYIPVWSRYYYITDITVVNGMMRIAMHCDVLKSFATDIRNSSATITRSNYKNEYIRDNLVQLSGQHDIQLRTLCNLRSLGLDTSDRQYILVTSNEGDVG